MTSCNFGRGQLVFFIAIMSSKIKVKIMMMYSIRTTSLLCETIWFTMGERTLTAYRFGSATGGLCRMSIIYDKSFIVNILHHFALV